MSFVLVATAWFFFAARADHTAALFLIAAVASSGAARLSIHDREYQANGLHSYQVGGYVDVSGRLYRSPGREPDRDVLFLDVGTIGATGEERPVRGRLRLSVPFIRETRRRLGYLVGDRIRASVHLSSGGAFRNFGAFSYERYLQGLGIHRRASTKSALLVAKTGSAPAGSARAEVSRVRQSIQAELEHMFPGPDGKDISPAGAVLEALLLGEDGRMDEPTVENLQKTGLYHLFAISGGHIAVINVLLFSLFRLLRMSRRASSLTLAIFLVFYTVLVEGSPSVLRATLMTLAFLAGRLLWKDVHVLNTIAASAFVLLLLNPSSLFDIGFELTYAATLTIILFTPPLLRRLPRLPLKATELACLSVTAALGAAPIIARNFNRITLSSLILNFAAIPLVGLVMGIGYAFLPFAAAFPAATVLPATVLGFLIAAFSWISHSLDPFSFLSFRIPTPPMAVLIGYYVSLGASLVRPRFLGQRPALLSLFSVFLLLIMIAPFRPASPDLKVTMIDVGQGESILVEFPGRRIMLIDGGGLASSPFDVGERVVSPVLWRKGIKRIDYLVLTHPHPDHLDGLVSVARNFRIGEFWEGRPARNDGIYAELGQALPPAVVRRRFGRGTHIDEGPVAIDVFHPPLDVASGPVPAGNENSLVIKITLGRTAFLFMGDTGTATEQALLDAGPDLASTVLKAGHHGSASSTSPDFLAVVRPRLVLVSAGEGNTYGFPSPDVLARCRSAGAEVLRTDIDGAVELRADGRMIAVRTAAAPGRQRAPDIRLTRTTKSMIIAVDKRSITAMGKKRLLVTLFLPLLLVSFLQSQSLAELAKKEKERRAALKGKGTTTVTTADLARVKKRPAVESAGQEEVAGDQTASTEQGQAQPGAAPPAAGQPATEQEAAAEQAKSAEAAAEEEKPAEETPPGEAPARSEKDIQKKQAELADLAQQKIEMVELLTLKLNALYQEFYGLDNLKSRELIQLQISDTYDKLLKAETESAKAQKDLEDFLAQTKKDSLPAIWIK